MIGILGTMLRTTCACQGADPQYLYQCVGWRRLLWLNPCVGEYSLLILPEILFKNMLLSSKLLEINSVCFYKNLIFCYLRSFLSLFFHPSFSKCSWSSEGFSHEASRRVGLSNDYNYYDYNNHDNNNTCATAATTASGVDYGYHNNNTSPTAHFAASNVTQADNANISWISGKCSVW